MTTTRSADHSAAATAGAATEFEWHDASFVDVVGHAPRLVHVIAAQAHEGPVYVAEEDALYFTTLPHRDDEAPASPRVRIERLALDGMRFPLEPERLSVIRRDANAANGMSADGEGRLIVCEQGTPSQHARIARLDPLTGTDEAIVDAWAGLRLNSPNDVVTASDDSIWFTDPSYGYLQGFKPRPAVGDHVYRFEPGTGRLTVVSDSFDKPNGIAFSPDERVLYVTDSGANQEAGSYHVDRPHHIKAFDVEAGRRLRGERLFAVITPGFPDGIKVDAAGRVYASSFDGIQVFDPDGELIGEIHLPGAVNFTFGGPDRNVLYITTDVAVWAAVLSATGPTPRPRQPKGA